MKLHTRELHAERSHSQVSRASSQKQLLRQLLRERDGQTSIQRQWMADRFNDEPPESAVVTFSNVKRVKRIFDLLREIDDLTNQLRKEFLSKTGMSRIPEGWSEWERGLRQEDLRGLKQTIDAKTKSLNDILSVYRWTPQVLCNGKSLQRYIDFGHFKGLSPRFVENRVVDCLLSDAEKGYLHRFKQCRECRKWFWTPTDHQKFCSDACRKRYSSCSEEYRRKRREYMKSYRLNQETLDRAAVRNARG